MNVSDHRNVLQPQAGFLSLKQVTKSYGNTVVVKGIDLEVSKGEFVSLLGPSGCGKTTTLQLIAGFDAPNSGSISLDGQDLIAIPANKRGIGIVFQNYALFPHMKISENVEFGLRMRKVPKSERETRVRQALDLVHLAAYGGRFPRELSGGQQQRIALARALVLEPRLLLLDEPFSNLDAKLKEDLQIELRALQRKLNITTILVTHDQNEALALSDRVAIMHAGQIAQLDTPFEAYERPSTPFVGQFLGKTNVLRVPTTKTSTGLRAGSNAGGDHVTIAIRPEKILLTVPGANDGPVMVGQVTARIFQGNSWLYQVATEVGQVLIVRPNDGAPSFEEGVTVGLAWSPDQIRVVPDAC